VSDKYLVAIYLRLSDEDEGENINESNSIQSQRELIKDYINRHDDLLGCDTVEFCDDGYSGTDFSRPSVSDMLNQIKKGNIRCIIVKDFSRFGRNYIEVGNYMEQVFPFLGVRFISINDGYDSDQNASCSEFIGVAFKNLVYDLYSKDLSEKIISVRRSKAEQGKFITGYAPYGYLKSDIQQLVVDEEAAEIVKRIFNMVLKGVTKVEIARTLNKEQIPTPLMLRKMRKQHFPCYHVNEKCVWQTSVISTIVKDQRYMGDAVYGKVKPTSVGSGKDRAVPKKEWIIVPNMHQPIISRSVFEQVNATCRHYSCRQKVEPSPLAGKIRCGSCNHAISRNFQREKMTLADVYFRCDIQNVTDEFACYSGNISGLELEKAVLNVLNQVSTIVADLEMRRMQQTDNKEDIRQIEKRIVNNECLEKRYQVARLQAYESYKSGFLSKALFMEYQKNYDTKVSALMILLQEDKTRLYEVKRKPIDMLDIVTEIRCFMPFSKLTSEMADTFIDTIYIQSDGSLKVKWKFNDIFTEILNQSR